MDIDLQKLHALVVEDNPRTLKLIQAVLKDMQELLELLLTENRADRLKKERERIGNYIKEVERLIRLERSLKGETEAGEDHQRLADKQGQIAERATDLAAEIKEEVAHIDSLRLAARRAYQAQTEEIAESLRGGTLIRGEVLRRWQEFLGTGELLKVLTEGAGRVRRWATKVFGGSRKVEEINDEAGDEIVAAVVRRADLAAGATAASWELDDAGKILLTSTERELWRHDPETPERAKTAIEDWIAELGELITEQGAGKRRWAQVASFGVNATALVVLLAVFAQTGGITGAEFGVAAGAAAAQQKILEHVFGGAAARSLIEEARGRLVVALGLVLAEDERRFATIADAFTSAEGTADSMRQEAQEVRARAEVFYGR